jgi:hypothetical protein
MRDYPFSNIWKLEKKEKRKSIQQSKVRDYNFNYLGQSL